MDELRFTARVPPGWGSINNKWETGFVIKQQYRDFKTGCTVAAMRAAGCRLGMRGPLGIEIVEYWPRVHRKGPAEGLPFGDLDAPEKAIYDALKDALVIEDDACFVRCTLEKHHDKENPRVEVRVFTIDEWLEG